MDICWGSVEGGQAPQIALEPGATVSIFNPSHGSNAAAQTAEYYDVQLEPSEDVLAYMCARGGFASAADNHCIPCLQAPVIWSAAACFLVGTSLLSVVMLLVSPGCPPSSHLSPHSNDSSHHQS
jgi:hypothetical protein